MAGTAPDTDRFGGFRSGEMRALRAVVEDGNVILEGPLDVKGRYEAILVVLDPDPWDSLVRDPRPRPELIRAREEAQREFVEGKTTPLDPDRMP
jgi:hypothetical protein